jgi:hypothetical protein
MRSSLDSILKEIRESIIYCSQIYEVRSHLLNVIQTSLIEIDFIRSFIQSEITEDKQMITGLFVSKTGALKFLREVLTGSIFHMTVEISTN